MFGAARALGELRSLCDAKRLALVEDVSHAHGAVFRGQPVGSFGDISFCSFQGSKLVAAGEGGALLTNRPDLFYRAMELAHPRRLEHAPPEWQSLSGVGRGFKFRPSPLLIALAQESLKQLDDQNSVRRCAWDELREQIAACRGFVNLDRSDKGRVYYRYELVLRPELRRVRDRLVEVLADRGVRAHKFVGYLPNLPSLRGHLRPGGDWPVAQDVMERVFYLDAFTAYSSALVQRHGRTILQTMREVEAGVP
jgi:dTDP-4-amino-4,6-dideoxygalactose transaminase